MMFVPELIFLIRLKRQDWQLRQAPGRELDAVAPGDVSAIFVSVNGCSSHNPEKKKKKSFYQEDKTWLLL